MKGPRKWMKKFVCALSVFAMSAASFTPVIYAQDAAKEKEEAAAIQDVQSYIAIEQTSGKILMQKNQDEVRGIASMSKMISQYLILEAIKKGEITWETKIPISARANQLSANYNLSNVPLWPNEKYTIKELFDAISIYSANAATLAIAEYIGGSEANWIERMKAKLNEWGIKDATIINVTGLPNKYGGNEKNPTFGDEDENSMSARSVAIIAKNLVNDFPEILKVSSIPTQTFRPNGSGTTKMDNFNYLLPGLLFEYEGVTGLKTGTSESGGASITTTATRNGFSVIVVSMGSKEPLNRFKVTRHLLDELFKKYEGLIVGSPGKSVQNLAPIPLEGGTEETLSVDYGKPFVAAVPKGTSFSQIKIGFVPLDELKTEDGKVKAPIQAGQTVGTLTFEMPGENLGYVDGKDHGTVEALAAYDVDQSNVVTESVRGAKGFIGQVIQKVQNFFGNVWSEIQNLFTPTASK